MTRFSEEPRIDSTLVTEVPYASYPESAGEYDSFSGVRHRRDTHRRHTGMSTLSRLAQGATTYTFFTVLGSMTAEGRDDADTFDYFRPDSVWPWNVNGAKKPGKKNLSRTFQYPSPDRADPGLLHELLRHPPCLPAREGDLKISSHENKGERVRVPVHLWPSLIVSACRSALSSAASQGNLEKASAPRPAGCGTNPPSPKSTSTPSSRSASTLLWKGRRAA